MKTGRTYFIKKARKLVIKVGSSLLLKEEEIDLPFVTELVDSIDKLLKEGKQVVLVSSGAIALGSEKVKGSHRFQNLKAIPSKQALASIGQIQLMDLYYRWFEKRGLIVGQVLLTAGDLSHRLAYLNARNTILTLLNLETIPVVNENDTVAVEEIKFGDNDTLSALVAGLIDADLLVILSDIEGLYTCDPKKNPRAELIPLVDRINREIEQMAQGTCVEGRVGGMQTKIEAAKVATRSGIPVIIGGGRGFLKRLFSTAQGGTLFLPAKDRLQAKKQWIAYGSKVKGKILVDEGAKEAILKKGGSLLPVGIKGVVGKFQPGDTVELVDFQGKEFARGIVYYSNQELEKLKGVHTQEIEKKLGYKYYDEVIHRDNLVII